jgi:hypothetical protein
MTATKLSRHLWRRVNILSRCHRAPARHPVLGALVRPGQGLGREYSPSGRERALQQPACGRIDRGMGLGSWDEMKLNTGCRAELMGAVKRQVTESYGADNAFIGASICEFESTIHAMEDTLDSATARIHPLIADALNPTSNEYMRHVRGCKDSIVRDAALRPSSS